jgi:hypothetical protein
MAQYYATNRAATDERYILLSRRISEREWSKAIEILEDLEMEEGFLQEYEPASYYYRPDFNDKEKPFKDRSAASSSKTARSSAKVRISSLRRTTRPLMPKSRQFAMRVKI